jgi:hypothetical protein
MPYVPRPSIHFPRRARSLVAGATAALAALTAGVCSASAATDPAPAVPTTPPPVTVLQHTGLLGPGYNFITPTYTPPPPPGSVGPPPPPGSATGPYSNGAEIVDDAGRPVWFLPLANGLSASDFRVQSYLGQPVLTWFEQIPTGLGPGAGTGFIANTNYQVIATVNAGNGLTANGHEFQLTPNGDALLVANKVVTADETSVGGPTNGLVEEGVVQEVNVATGKVVFEWDSLDHVPLTDSHAALPPNPATTPYDYFHVNAAKLDSDGNLLISARNSWTVYKVNIQTGATIWELGGKQSTFKLGPGVQFAWQHDPVVDSSSGPQPGQGGWAGERDARANAASRSAHRADFGGAGDEGVETLTIFDDESSPAPLTYSRVITVQVNTQNDTATLLSAFKHPDALLVPSQGNAQPLPDGNTFVDWGALGRYSEFNQSGNLIYDVLFAPEYESYRAYHLVWQGNPSTPPTGIATPVGSSTATVQAVWNGATQVAYWQVLGGSSSSSLQPVGAASWNGLDTTISISTQPQYVQVVAYNHQGQEIGSSPVTTEGA